VTQDILNGITEKLKSSFGKEVYIIGEGDEKPKSAFSLQLKKMSQKQMIGNRYYLKQAFEISYNPETYQYDELQMIVSSLYEQLEYITVLGGDLIRGTKMTHQISEGMVLFYMNYNLLVKRENEEENLMETLDLNTDRK